MIDTLCKDIVRQLKINRLVETGTDKGETVAEVSRWFSEISPDFGTITETITTGARAYRFWNQPIRYPVFLNSKHGPYQIHSVEIHERSYQNIKKLFQANCNIYLYHSSSEKFLNFLLAPELKQRHASNNYLFFLDAHWEAYWPLLDELKIIRQLDKYVVVIDDFMVPGKSDPSRPNGLFGFDVYKRKILNWAYIYDLFTTTKIRIFYPVRPNPDGRGWVLIIHGYSDAELKFLESLELVEQDQSDEACMTLIQPTWRTYMDVRNIVKMVVPASLLRSVHRVYEIIRYHFENLFMNINSRF